MIKKYEAMFFIKPNEDENKIKDIINKINNIMIYENCEIYYKEEKGIYNLAYEIKGNRKAFYYYIKFKTLDDKVPALGRVSKKVNTIAEIIKHIII